DEETGILLALEDPPVTHDDIPPPRAKGKGGHASTPLPRSVRRHKEPANLAALSRLRDGARAAIEVLGRGFLAHPANAALRAALRDGGLAKEDFYRHVLRLVYRLLFLFVAEDRGLLAPPGADPRAAERYRRYYSTARLRELAAKCCGSEHHDLYHA